MTRERTVVWRRKRFDPCSFESRLHVVGFDDLRAQAVNVVVVQVVFVGRHMLQSELESTMSCHVLRVPKQRVQNVRVFGCRTFMVLDC